MWYLRVDINLIFSNILKPRGNFIGKNRWQALIQSLWLNFSFAVFLGWIGRVVIICGLDNEYIADTFSTFGFIADPTLKQSRGTNYQIILNKLQPQHSL